MRCYGEDEKDECKTCGDGMNNEEVRKRVAGVRWKRPVICAICHD